MIGLYLHVPYCKQACSYCDFYFTTNVASIGRFARAVLTELTLRAPHWPGTLQSVYFGGGTPSLLPLADLERILQGIRLHYVLSPEAEITIEANPDDLAGAEGFERLQAWHAMGINRLSIGLQSFDAAHLAWMHRAHSAEHAEQALDRARAAGFSNVSVDLMYDLPGLSRTDWQTTLQRVLAQRPEHLSCYGLTIEPRTALAHWVAHGRLRPAAEGSFAEQFLLLHALATAAGYEHYEVSNLALPARRAQHNSAYWQGAAWLALGPSAHGSDGQSMRYHNHPQLHAYLEALEHGQLPPCTEEHLSPAERQNEFLLTRLRTREGLSWAELLALDPDTPADWWRQVQHKAELAATQGLAQHSDDGLRLTPQGWLVADALTEALLRV